MKAFFMTFILKFCLGAFDVASDKINGFNFLTGQYGLSVYFIAGVRSDFDNAEYGPNKLFGYLTLAVVWLPGAFRSIQIALDSNWSDLSIWKKIKKSLFLIIMAAAWPMFNVFM